MKKKFHFNIVKAQIMFSTEHWRSSSSFPRCKTYFFILLFSSFNNHLNDFKQRKLNKIIKLHQTAYRVQMKNKKKIKTTKQKMWNKNRKNVNSCFVFNDFVFACIK